MEIASGDRLLDVMRACGRGTQSTFVAHDCDTCRFGVCSVNLNIQKQSVDDENENDDAELRDAIGRVC